MSHAKHLQPCGHAVCSATLFLATLQERGVRVWLDAGQLRYQAAKGILSTEDLRELRARKIELIEHLTLEQDLPLRPRPPGSSAPLTATQLRWWTYINDRQMGLSERLCRVAVRVRGELQEALLRECIAAIMQRHESLRTRIVIEGSSPKQSIAAYGKCAFEAIDLSHLSTSEAEAQTLQLGANFVTEKVDLSRGPLFAAKLFKLSDREFVLIFALEHVITDGVSNAILHNELWSCYAQAAQGRMCSLPPLPVQYADYALWQEQSHPRWLRKHAAYWREHLRNAPEPVLSLDRQTSSEMPPSHERLELPIGYALTHSLRELAREQRNLLAVVVLTIFVAAMSRWCRQSDLLLLFVADARFRPELTNLVGFVSNCLHLRVRVNQEGTFSELLREVTSELRCAYEHHDFDRVPYLLPECKTELGFNWMPTKWMWERVPGIEEHAGLQLEPFPLDVPWPRAFLPMFLDTPNGVVVSVTFRADLFQRGTIERLVQEIKQLAERFARNPGVRLSSALSA